MEGKKWKGMNKERERERGDGDPSLVAAANMDDRSRTCCKEYRVGQLKWYRNSKL